MKKIKNFLVTALFIFVSTVLLFATVIFLFTVDTNNKITGWTFEKKRPEPVASIHSDFVQEYKTECREAVQDYRGESIDEDYIRCAYTGWDMGMYYYCKLDSGQCLRYEIEFPYWKNLILGTPMPEDVIVGELQIFDLIDGAHSIE